MKKLLLLLLLGYCGSALADSSCDQPKNDFDGLYCLNKVYLQADKELNATYGKLSRALDAAGKKKLKQGQLAWISSRNDQCSLRQHNSFYVDLKCATDSTIRRVQFLADRLRECNSAGCMNSQL
jgi:uncharacterized protein YecT (DUF1311 family)